MSRFVLEICGLTKAYGDALAVENLDIAVAPGEILGLLGPNGAGKTTTIRMVTGLLAPSSGSARVFGHDCYRERPQVMRHVGYLPDEPTFHDYLRGSEVLQFVAEMHGLDRTSRAARIGALVERLDLGEALDDFAVHYSKGMRKRLALACALLHGPQLLILDEPTNGL
ncbi:MAG: ABC transporter ATP-binding protein, partial [Planctomycetes bacterium]|nr:ABC transporter ATP-binding protein [Planctomycetota bacterium]